MARQTQATASTREREHMSTSAIKVPPRQREAIPTDSPLEAGAIVCGGCGNVMAMEVRMGPRSVEEIVYTCINEERGCKYQLTRKVPVFNYTQKGIRDEAK